MSCSSIPSASSPITFDVQTFMSSTCFQCESNGCPASIDSKCVFYLGPNLSCSGVETGDSVETIFQKIDAQICSAIGDYSSYQFNCLVDWFGEPITQESQFVNAITAYACQTTDTLDTFINTTFPAYQSDVTSRIGDVSNPVITCTSAGVTALDSLETILTKYCTKFGEIDDAISISGVTWDECLTVVSTPTTIAEAFSLVVDQICQVEALTGAALPTFNNLGSCLASPGASDSLVDTIDKIKTRLCLSPTFNSNNLTPGCVFLPLDSGDIEGMITNICTSVTALIQAAPVFSGDFIVTTTNPLDPCSGVTVSLATPLNQDRLVASDALDGTPGTLADKLLDGTNIFLDFVSSPGQVIFNATATALDYKVKASSGDSSPDFLDQKVAGSSSSGVTLAPIYNAISEKVDLTLSVDTSTLLDLLLDELVVGSDLYNKFCNKVSQCPCNCGAGECTRYSITANDMSCTVNWVDCVSGTIQSIDLGCNGNFITCARNGSITHTNVDGCGVSPGLFILPIEDCAGGTTTTSTSTTTIA